MENPFDQTEPALRMADPTALVIFGATGDLTSRRLVPALYNLGREGLLSSNFACVGFARREKTDGVFRSEMREAISKFSRVKPIDEPFWSHFQEKLFYHEAEFDDDAGYEGLKKKLLEIDQMYGTKQNRVYYLSVPPKYFPVIVEKLHKHGLLYKAGEKEPFSRVIIEKPFGKDLASAKELQKTLETFLDESQIYRIDHYLGKETVQNILVFRFANSIFESLWNYKHIDHVQITVAEEIGIGTRGNFFEEEGLLRDIVQNHMLQLLSLIAMEPPVSLMAHSIHDEKVKVLQSVRVVGPVTRGQYTSGFTGGEEVLGYRQEANVNPHSATETFAALHLQIDNWRFSGVPFYLRAGKRLPKRATEIAIRFKDAPGVLFQQAGRHNEPNVLVLRIQPDEGISLRINSKVPGALTTIRPVKMDFRYGSYFGLTAPEAYERLIWDCILGDTTLFARCDEVMESWRIVTPILEEWKKKKEIPLYAAGTWGPEEANQIVGKGQTWRLL